MAKLQSSEFVGVANRPATICVNTVCLWFDTTNLKPMASYCSRSGAGVWSAGGAMIIGRFSPAGAGTQNEGLASGGSIGGGSGSTSCTEEYNGTSWSSGGILIVARYGLIGGGTQNSGLVSGGFSNSLVARLTCTE